MEFVLEMNLFLILMTHPGPYDLGQSANKPFDSTNSGTSGVWS